MPSSRTEPTTGFQLTGSAMRWMAVGLIISSAVVVIISVFSGVSLSDFATIGILPFGLAAAASVAELLIGVVRFRMVAKGVAKNPRLNLDGISNVKLASEFLSLTTPSYTGGFLLSTAWLSKRGVEHGDAVWIGYFEILIQVYVSSAVEGVAAAYALSKGAVMIASTLTAVSLCSALAFTAIFLIPGLRGVTLPHSIFRLAARVVGPARAKRLERGAQKDTRKFSSAARALLHRESLPLVAKTVGLTVVEALLSGLALWFVIVAAGLKIDVFSSTLVAYSVIAIGTLPISIGGSGITELVMKYYLFSVYGFSSWAAIVLWRIASYQVLLGVSGIAFLILMRRAMSSAPNTPTREAREIAVANR
jgi:glycosyltransferase 2 family protein